ncbi:MAG: hypothetical protein M1813_009266 [Trichoglossum hirsutum]|nr:MAG: hypothetical protein M1813_009266 [Trichoglossum hirsutum]
MTLLIPYDGKPDRSVGFNFGETEGELEVPVRSFRDAVTRFESACKRAGYSPYFLDSVHLRDAKQYNLINSVEDAAGHDKFHSMTSFIYTDIGRRDIRFVSERLAIHANCCNYSERLDAKALARAGYGLSGCIITQFFLNGEVFHNDAEDPTRSWKMDIDLFDYTAEKFIKGICFSEFEPPGEAYQTSFINHCRFSDVDLCPQGVETKGWLWKLDDPYRVDCGDSDTDGFDDEYSFRRYLTTSFAGKLEDRREWKLAEELSGHLSRISNDNGKNASWFKDMMIKGLAEEVGRSGTVRLGRLVGDQSGRACAIFADRTHGAAQSDPAFVFTGWSPGREGHLAKFVSLGVRKDGTTADGRTRLITQSWLTGLWFARGRKSRYVFPWPLPVTGT